MMLQSAANRAILTKILAGVPAYAAAAPNTRADALDAALARVAHDAGPVPPASRDEMVRANKAAIRLTIAYISYAAPVAANPEYVPRDQAQADSAARVAELFSERQKQYAPPPAVTPPAALVESVSEKPPDNIDALYQQKLSERDADLSFAPPPPVHTAQSKDDTVVFAKGDPPASVGRHVSWQTDATETLRAEVAALRAEVAALRAEVAALRSTSAVEAVES
jgi:hypothetical protein